jgi:oxazoline/thiazoline synthase
MSLSFSMHADVLPLHDTGLVAITEQGCEVYPGAAFARLGALVDGAREEQDILAECGDVEHDAVASAITDLRRAGLLVENGRKAGVPSEAAWWESQRIPADRAAARIASASVQVRTIGEVDPEPTIAALTGAGIRVLSESSLTVVLTDDYLNPDLAEVNERELEQEHPWLLAAPAATQVLVGPVFVPGRGPCWDCLAERVYHLRAVERRMLEVAGAEHHFVRKPGPASARGAGAAMLATELTRWLAGSQSSLDSIVLRLDVRTWSSDRHHVVWRPQCPACGESEPSLERPATPIKLRRGSSLQDGAALRVASPEVTIRRFEHHVSPVCGAVAMLRKVSGAEPLHVYVAGGPVAQVHGDRASVEDIAGMPAGGKGTSDAAARASALCEALERYSGDFTGDEPRRTASYEELGERTLHPNEYMRFSERQYEERERWNTQARSFRTFVPERFDPSARIDWSPCWSLTTEQEWLLPTALLYYGAGVAGHQYCVPESNGNAAGNTVEEAILHGVLELVERDHVALWWYNRLRAPAVDLDSLDDPWLEQLRAHIAGQNRQMWALDLTADLGIPVAVAVAASPDGGGIGMGFGAHVDFRCAVIRAFTELVQLGLGAPSGGVGSGVPQDLHLDKHPFLGPDPSLPPRRFVHTSEAANDVISALEFCQAAIEQQGIEMLVLDQTRPDIGLPVVKVLAPGLRHFWTRFGPGRLYDVPVALGLLDTPRAEADLTPRPPTS